MLRVLKLQLESRIKKPLDVDAPIVQWMARWAAMILSRFKSGKDNKTAYERQRGKRCRMDLVPFGEKVWFRPLVSSDGRKRSMKARWEEGIWLGHCRESNEVWKGHEGNAVRAWAVRRRIPKERWGLHAIVGLKAKPWNTTEGKVQLDESNPKEGAEQRDESEPSTEEDAEGPRHIKLRRKDFEKYGITSECPGCVRLKRGAKPPYRHNDVCRARMEKHIAADDKPRWERYNLRTGSGQLACDDPEEANADTESKPSGTPGVLARDSLGESSKAGLREAEEAPSDEHGFHMISPLIDRLTSIDVVEAFSPPRITAEAKKFGSRPGEAWDLTEGWDFRIESHRKAALRYQEDEKPTGGDR